MKLAQINTTVELQQPEPGIASANEIDSNADTCCAGNNFVVLNMTR